MGADFITIRLSIGARKNPNFKKGYAHIAKLAKTPFEKWPKEYRERFDDDNDPVQEAQVIEGDLNDIEERWNGEGRDFTIFRVDRKRVFLTGGFSYGDSPCELWDAIDRATSAGATKACGFDW